MASPLNILVVEDHDLLREATVAALQNAGHNATGLVAAEEVANATQRQRPHLYLIDLNLPGEDGISLSKRLRAAQPQAGIIMVTARTASDERVAGYASGADIYLTKPVSLEELLAAVEALGRRVQLTAKSTPTISLNCTTLQLQGPAGTLTLALSEARLLTAFSQAKDNTLERAQAMELISSNKDISDANLEVRLSQLRKKLLDMGASDNPIRPIRGVGYRLCLPLQLENGQE